MCVSLGGFTQTIMECVWCQRGRQYNKILILSGAIKTANIKISATPDSGVLCSAATELFYRWRHSVIEEAGSVPVWSVGIFKVLEKVINRISCCFPFLFICCYVFSISTISSKHRLCPWLRFMKTLLHKQHFPTRSLHTCLFNRDKPLHPNPTPIMEANCYATLAGRQPQTHKKKPHLIHPIFHIYAKSSHFVHISLLFCFNKSNSCSSMLNICLTGLAFCFLVGNNHKCRYKLHLSHAPGAR